MHAPIFLLQDKCARCNENATIEILRDELHSTRRRFARMTY